MKTKIERWISLKGAEQEIIRQRRAMEDEIIQERNISPDEKVEIHNLQILPSPTYKVDADAALLLPLDTETYFRAKMELNLAPYKKASESVRSMIDSVVELKYNRHTFKVKP